MLPHKNKKKTSKNKKTNQLTKQEKHTHTVLCAEFSFDDDDDDDEQVETKSIFLSEHIVQCTFEMIHGKLKREWE